MPPLIDSHTVIVLGAGATRAFLPAAPLGVDDYKAKGIRERFSNFQHARALLDAAMAPHEEGHIDIEQLMTRLHGRMPYDDPEDVAEQAHLLIELTKEFINRIRTAKAGTFHKEVLAALATTCIANRATCITFNYDDVLDQALWEVKKMRGGFLDRFTEPNWHPDGGYGFFLPPSENTVDGRSSYMDKTPSLLLKLHGSINWYPRLGEVQPYRLNSLYHNQEWYPPEQRELPEIDKNLVTRHLAPSPFFIPPVLDKKALANEPILQVIWSLAKESLLKATTVYFVGYSMPVTDLAASFLFKEALASRSDIIRVVNKPTQDDAEKSTIRNAYEKVFGSLRDEQFMFCGALEWAMRIGQYKIKAT